MNERPVPSPADAPASADASRPYPAWVRDAICWQVYPLGFCGAPRAREDLDGASYGDDGENVVHRLGRIEGWLDHLVALGANVLLLNPIFDSVSHGYDTLDHHRLDARLGDDADWQRLVAACRGRGIRIVLDGVFNHVSDRHPVVRRALAQGPEGPDASRIRWSGEHPYGFEGNPDLVELALTDPAVQDAIVQVMGEWLDRGADGWRLDAMYAAGPETWAPILERVRAEHPDAWIHGEVIHGEHPGILAASTADGLTQYELWKAIWSSLREANLFELSHALGRHEGFLADSGRRLPLVFLGNHDTTRIASQLPDGRHLAPAISLLAMLPGVPSIYAGDELGAVGVKEDRPGGDDAVRPAFPEAPEALLSGEPAGVGGDVALLAPEAAGRILEAHRRMLGLRRRHPWLADAHVRVRPETLANEVAEIELTATGGEASLVLALNLGDEDRPAPGEVLEAIAGGAMLDGTAPPAPGTVPAHGAAVVR